MLLSVIRSKYCHFNPFPFNMNNKISFDRIKKEGMGSLKKELIHGDDLFDTL